MTPLRLTKAFAVLACAAFGAAVQASPSIPAPISDAVADSHRPPEQRRLDDARKPAEVIAFAGVKPGDRVADFMPGNAYLTRILSKVVGPTGACMHSLQKSRSRTAIPQRSPGPVLLNTMPGIGMS